MRKSYLTELQEAKLLEAHSKACSNYEITQKGKEYLRKFRELQNIADLSSGYQPNGMSGQNRRRILL
jgi:predicted transcriptional regulator